MSSNIQNTVTSEFSEQTFKHKDLVFAQHLRQVIAFYRNDLTNHQIYLSLTEEAKNYDYEGLATDVLPKEQQ